MNIEMLIRRALLSLIDEGMRVAIRPVDDDPFSLQPESSKDKQRRGIACMVDGAGGGLLVRFATVKDGYADVDEVRDLVLKALEGQGLRDMEIEGDTITI